MAATGKTLVVLNRTDEIARRSFRNLPDVRISEPGQVTTYDVLWSDQVVFTTSTVGAVSRPAGYGVSDSDFVKEGATA
jgi:large subunit ribosomal protein L4